ncbi:hypothetical protein GW916_13725 [bacterium]|nr:hypothetical protein [bacterium]
MSKVNKVAMVLAFTLISPLAFGDWGPDESGDQYEVVLKKSIDLDQHVYYDDVSYYSNSKTQVHQGNLISNEEYEQIQDPTDPVCSIQAVWHEQDPNYFSPGSVVGPIEWDITMSNLDIINRFSHINSREISVRTQPTGQHNYLLIGCYYKESSIFTPTISDSQFKKLFEDLIEIRRIN